MHRVKGTGHQNLSVALTMETTLVSLLNANRTEVVKVAVDAEEAKDMQKATKRQGNRTQLQEVNRESRIAHNLRC